MSVIVKIQKFCCYQDRSEYEVRRKLKTFPISLEEQNQIVEQLIFDKFIDDQRFAVSFVNGKMNTKGWGVLKIKNGLTQKGISSKIIQETLKEIEGAKFEQILLKEIEKWKRSYQLSSETKPKLIRFLLSKGFTYNEIMNNLK
ncbi:MAG: RecX family transcriptional regulator [Bacteroidetes bacterium HGW-Bacteroidetes-20]|nr:MAG: RecX family transcriptional regulator [Bacteroidetes bacterium HGW-Bacteroidetes-20]